MKVLVTGAGGFIGSYLAELLITDGHAVRAFLHYNSRSDVGNLRYVQSDIRRSMEIIYGDLADPVAVTKAVRGTTHVFHLGALIAIPYSYIHPFSFVQTNIVGTANVLNACLELGTERLVMASTSEVYGTAVTVPMDETHRLHPQSPYAASKASADHLAQSYARSFDLPVVLVRPFNTFGPRQSMRAVIPTIIMQVLRNGSIEVGSTSPTRDFNYVTDIANGFALAGTVDSVPCDGRVFNLGSGVERSIGDVINTVSSILCWNGSTHLCSERLRPDTSEVQRLMADSKLAARELKWVHGGDRFHTNLVNTINWYDAHLKEFPNGNTP